MELCIWYITEQQMRRIEFRVTVCLPNLYNNLSKNCDTLMKHCSHVPWQKSANEFVDGRNRTTATPTKRY